MKQDFREGAVQAGPLMSSGLGRKEKANRDKEKREKKRKRKKKKIKKNVRKVERMALTVFLENHQRW